MGKWGSNILLSTFMCLRFSIMNSLGGRKQRMQPHRVWYDGRFPVKMSNEKLKLVCIVGQGEG